MLSRRIVAGALAALAFTAGSAMAQDWRAKIKEVRFGISSGENAEHALARNEPLRQYLEKKLGVPVRLFRSADYAGLVEALKSNNLDFARMGPATYALANKLMGKGIEPLLRDIDHLGAEGYFSVLAVKGDSPYKSIDDLKGKSIGWADPNSTSGFQYPSYFLRKGGYDPEKYFGKNAFSGSHETGVMALHQGTFDVVATHWTNETQGNIQRMEEKGMIPKGITRVIWKSPLIPNSPWVGRADQPTELKALFVEAIKALPTEGAEAWKILTDGKVRGVTAAKHEDYLDVIAVTNENDKDRKRLSN